MKGFVYPSDLIDYNPIHIHGEYFVEPVDINCIELPD